MIVIVQNVSPNSSGIRARDRARTLVTLSTSAECSTVSLSGQSERGGAFRTVKPKFLCIAIEFLGGMYKVYIMLFKQVSVYFPEASPQSCFKKGWVQNDHQTIIKLCEFPSAL